MLSAASAECNAGVVVERVDVVSTERCGDGAASTADRVLVHLTHAEGTGEGPPQRLILKTMPATPHAPEAVDENEVRFHRELRGSWTHDVTYLMVTAVADFDTIAAVEEWSR